MIGVCGVYWFVSFAAIRHQRLVGTKFLLLQNIFEDNPELGGVIVNTGASLLPESKGALSSCPHWLYYAEEIELLSDSNSLLGMLNQPLNDIKDRRLHRILVIHEVGSYSR